mmetsp:Transcript_59701/g.192119  ORF Transcript_59701/g.192119 Transcript_59701/m.192119 type:complete len:664 (-) Transcript_59701:57-2048(-)
MQDDGQQSESLWKQYCPSLAVYLPKFVTVQNPKLGLLNAVLTFLVIIFTGYYFVSNDKYLITKVPDIQVSFCGTHCAPSAAEMDRLVQAAGSEAYCTDQLVRYVRDGETFTNIQCAGRCGATPAGSSCMRPGELMQTDAHGLFVPTFYRETYYAPRSSNTSSCPPGFGGAPGSSEVCRRHGDHFVASPEAVHITFNHEFSVEPYRNSFDMLYRMPDKKSHSGSFNSQGWEKGMATILFGHDTTELATWEQNFAVNATLGTLLGAAYYDGMEEGDPTLTLDTAYSRPERGVTEATGGAGEPLLRLTGAVLTVDLYVTDRGECPVYDTFRKKILKIKVESGRPVACMTVHAERMWVGRQESVAAGPGASRIRETFGVRVQFRKMGKFTFLNEQSVVSNFTVFFVWIQIPLVITYWFTCFCLGVLSNIYSRVLHQELKLPEACGGLVARLMSHSSAYMDLKDSVGGVSKQRIRDRFRDYLKDNEAMDDDELSRLVDFVFDGLKSTGHHPTGHKDHVSLQEFCEVCSNNEPLTFSTIVKLFDQDRQLSALEGLFLDASIRRVRNARSAKEEGEEPASSRPRADLEGTNHSQVDEAYRGVQELMTKLNGFEKRAFQSAKNLEVGEDVLALIGVDETAALGAQPQPAKLQQAESFASIEDEGSPGREEL